MDIATVFGLYCLATRPTSPGTILVAQVLLIFGILDKFSMNPKLSTCNPKPQSHLSSHISMTETQSNTNIHVINTSIEIKPSFQLCQNHIPQNFYQVTFYHNDFQPILQFSLSDISKQYYTLPLTNHNIHTTNFHNAHYPNELPSGSSFTTGNAYNSGFFPDFPTPS